MKVFVKSFLNLIPRTILIKCSYFIRPILAFFLKGRTYTDPINGKSYKIFLPYGYQNVRTNVLSPGTFSLERHRLLWLFLQHNTNFFTEKLKVLHFAPEQSFFKRFKKQSNLDYITIDLHSPLADVKADICQLPFEDNSFDVVLCNHVLEHIPEDKKAMQELFRVLKPKGWGVFQVPQDISRKTTFEDNTIVDKKERTRIFGQYDHVRVYGLDYFDRLRAVGFMVEQVYMQQHMSVVDIKKYCLNPNEIIPLVRVP